MYRLKCLICGQLDNDLARLQEHVMREHGYSQEDLRRAVRRGQVDWLEAVRGELSVRELILAKPEPVREVIKAHMVKAALHDKTPDYEQYAIQALAWWREAVECLRRDIEAPEGVLSEESLASMILSNLMMQETWGRILRARMQ